MESQLRQAQKMEAIGTLASGIAHDFNNILGAIVGYAELARDDIQAGKSNTRDIEELIKAAWRAKNLVRQILTFSRKSDGTFRTHEPEPRAARDGPDAGTDPAQRYRH